MKALLQYLILPVVGFGLLCALFVQLMKRFPLYVAAVVGLLLIAGAISALRIKKKNEMRGWRVGHQGRDQMFYEELRDGRWERIDLDGEMLVGRAHHVIYFSSSRFPDWAESRREEIVARIKTEFRPPSYEYEEA
jgi:hypothetical protein